MQSVQGDVDMDGDEDSGTPAALRAGTPLWVSLCALEYQMTCNCEKVACGHTAFYKEIS